VMLSEAFHAAESLESRGHSLAVIDLPWLNTVDDEWLASAVGGTPRLFLIEDHFPHLGQSAFITQALARLGLDLPTHIFGVEGIPACGQNDEVLDHHGLSAARLADRMHALL